MNDTPRFSVPEIKPFDPKKLYGVKGSGPQYVDYTKKKGRSTEGQTMFNVGVTWLTGMVCGSLYGLQEGWRSAAAPTFRIRMNSVLNTMFKRGNIYSANMGTAMLMYCITDFLVADMSPILTGVDTRNFLGPVYGSPIVTGFITGGCYSSMRGPRAAVLGGVIGSVMSVVFVNGQNVVYNKY